MKPLGLTKRSSWDFFDLKNFKGDRHQHSSIGSRSARKALKRLVRSLKRSENNKVKNNFIED